MSKNKKTPKIEEFDDELNEAEDEDENDWRKN
jgi:hypothetical protein